MKGGHLRWRDLHEIDDPSVVLNVLLHVHIIEDLCWILLCHVNELYDQPEIGPNTSQQAPGTGYSGLICQSRFYKSMMVSSTTPATCGDSVKGPVLDANASKATQRSAFCSECQDIAKALQLLQVY